MNTQTLALELPEPVAETTITESAPVQMSEAQRLELVQQDAMLMKEEVRARLKKTLADASVINEERIRVEGAIGQAEQQLTLAAGGSRHNSGRAELLARKMLGEDVDVEAVEADNPIGAMTVGDINSGLRALKGQLEELKRRWANAQHVVKTCEGDFAKAHAVEWGAKYMAARQIVVDGWVQLRAAELMFNGSTPYPSPVFTSMDWEQFCVPACDGAEHMGLVKLPGMRIGRATISGETLRSTAVVLNATSAIRSEFTHKEG